MIKIITTLLALFILVVPATSQLTRDQLPPDVSRQFSDEQLELTNWMMFYYKKPLPDEFLSWLKRASAAGMLKEDKRQFPFLGFKASVFAKNADKIPQWMNTIDVLPKQDRKTVLIALWLSGTKSSKTALEVEARQKLISGPNYFNFETDKEPPSLDKINIYWGFLDIQWGRFSATGDEKPIRNIISVLEFAQFTGSRKKYPRPNTDEEKQAVLKEIFFQTALWSLRSNCQMHPKVLEICENIYSERSLSRLSQLPLQSILVQFNPEKYKRGETSNTGPAVWYDMKGQPLPDMSYRKATDGFGASLLLTDKDEDVFKRWDIPSVVFEVSATETIEKGIPITPLIFFSGCKEDAKGNCNVVATYKIIQPDGKLYGEIPGAEVWINKPGPPDKILGLTVQYIKIVIEPKDQLGKYTVDAEVIDLNKNVKLILRSSFTVVEQKSTNRVRGGD